MVVLKMLIMEITKMKKTTVDFDGLSLEEKCYYLNEKLNSIKPECFKGGKNKPSSLKPLGNFWVNLKGAEEYSWDPYAYEDFVIGTWPTDPNKLCRSVCTEDRRVGFFSGLNGGSADCAYDWDFGDDCGEVPEWFTQSEIDKGHIWVQPLFVHGEY